MKSSDTKLINTKDFPNKFKQDRPFSHMNSYGGVGGHTHLCITAWLVITQNRKPSYKI